MRAVLVVCASALLAFAVNASASLATPAAGGPFSLQNATESGGYPLAGSGPSGTSVRFINRGSFWVGVLLRNTSADRSLTIVGAKTPKPIGSLVRQVGAGFAPFAPCANSRMFCSFLGDPRHRPSPAPLTLAPHAMVGVKLDYRLVSCAAARAATTTSGRSLIVAYRYGSGPVRQQTFPLAGAKLLLHRPPRPAPTVLDFPRAHGEQCEHSVIR